MNYLSHHVAARLFAPVASDDFFVGNILPDLAQARLRVPEVVELEFGDLAGGVRLHHECDRAFHAAPEFQRLCAVVGESLRALPLAAPPRRTFFLAHVAVELALDGVLLRQEPGLAGDLLRRMPANRTAALAALADWRPDLASEFGEQWADRFDRFCEVGFVRNYSDDGQLVRSLMHLARQVGPRLLPEGSETWEILETWFAELREIVAPSVDALVRPPKTAWYNSDTS